METWVTLKFSPFFLHILNIVSLGLSKFPIGTGKDFLGGLFRSSELIGVRDRGEGQKPGSRI